MTTRMMQAVLAAVLVAGAFPVFGDVIELSDGRKISGTMARVGDNIVIKGDDGTVVNATPADVVRVSLTSGSPADAVKAEWTRVMAAIKKADDLAAVVSLLQKFQEKYPDAPMAQTVTDSLGAYQMLAKVGAVKFHGEWMPPEQIESMIAAWAEVARPAMEAYRAGRMKEALAAAEGVLTDDKDNQNAMTIAGLAAYRLNNLPVAKKHFSELADAGGPAALEVLARNNLAVIAYQQKQTGEGMQDYVKALAIQTTSRALLDNVTIAIDAYLKGGGDKHSTNFRKLSEPYDLAEAKMEVEMAKQGLFRQGSTWATKHDLDAAQQNLQAIHGKMNALDKQYQATNDMLIEIDAQLRQCASDYDAATKRLADIDAQISILDPRIQYNLVANLQPSRNQVAQDQDKVSQRKGALDGKRNVLVNNLQLFVGQAQELKAQLAAAEHPAMGNQLIMDMEDAARVPSAVAAVSATTQPAGTTQPSVAGISAAPTTQPDAATSQPALAGSGSSTTLPAGTTTQPGTNQLAGGGDFRPDYVQPVPPPPQVYPSSPLPTESGGGGGGGGEVRAPEVPDEAYRLLHKKPFVLPPEPVKPITPMKPIPIPPQLFDPTVPNTHYNFNPTTNEWNVVQNGQVVYDNATVHQIWDGNQWNTYDWINGQWVLRPAQTSSSIVQNGGVPAPTPVPTTVSVPAPGSSIVSGVPSAAPTAPSNGPAAGPAPIPPTPPPTTPVASPTSPGGGVSSPPSPVHRPSSPASPSGPKKDVVANGP